MLSSGDCIQYAVCYMAVWVFTALWAWLFSRHNTVDAAVYYVMSCDERGRQCCSMSCHIVSVQVCTEGSVSSLPVTLCYRYMFLWPPAVDAVTEHRQQTANDTIPLSILQFQQTTFLPICFSTAMEFHSLQLVVMFVCFIVYNESTAVTEKCVVVYRTAWI